MRENVEFDVSLRLRGGHEIVTDDPAEDEDEVYAIWTNDDEKVQLSRSTVTTRSV